MQLAINGSNWPVFLGNSVITFRTISFFNSKNIN